MALPDTWTESRRRIVSKTLFDLLKIEVGAAYASKFFAEFPIQAKTALTLLMIATVITAFFIYPKRDEKEKE